MFFKRLLVAFWAVVLFQYANATDRIIILHSPDGNIQINLDCRDNGDIIYRVMYKGRAVIAPSGLGFRLKVPDVSLNKFSLMSADSSMADETWKPVWGEQSAIRNNYKQLVLKLSDRS